MVLLYTPPKAGSSGSNRYHGGAKVVHVQEKGVLNEVDYA